MKLKTLNINFIYSFCKAVIFIGYFVTYVENLVRFYGLPFNWTPMTTIPSLPCGPIRNSSLVLNLVIIINNHNVNFHMSIFGDL